MVTNIIFNIFNYLSIHYVQPILCGTQSEDLDYSKISCAFTYLRQW